MAAASKMQPSSRCLQLQKARFSRLNNDALVFETDLLLSAREFITGYRKEIDCLALAIEHNPKSAATPRSNGECRSREGGSVMVTASRALACGKSRWLQRSRLGMYRGRITQMGRDRRRV